MGDVIRIPVASGIELETIVSRGSRDIGCIVAHPYGKLGGDLHNNLVIALAKSLAKMGLTVCRMNFRGVGRSDGTTSWRGDQEVDDVVKVAQYLLTLPEDDSMPAPRRIILVGYSWGSIFTTAAAELRPETLSEAIGTVAVAYPFGVMSHAFMLLKHLAPPPEPRLPSFNIIGTADNFTGVKNFEKKTPTPNPPLNTRVIVPDCDHFFFDHEEKVTEPVTKWIEWLISEQVQL